MRPPEPDSRPCGRHKY